MSYFVPSKGTKGSLKAQPAPPARQSGTPDHVAAVTETLAMLEVVASASEGMSLSEVSRRLKAPKTTVFRRLKTLEASGWIDRLDPDSRYRPTLKLYLLGQRAGSRMAVIEAARGPMEQLRDNIGETVNLAVLDGDDVVFLLVVPSMQRLRMTNSIGEREVAALTACGRALLASQPVIPAPLRGQPWVKFVLQHGFAVDDQEFTDGARCVGAAIRDASGAAQWGLSISGPVARLHDARLHELGETVRLAAEEISVRMGAPATARDFGHSGRSTGAQARKQGPSR